MSRNRAHKKRPTVERAAYGGYSGPMGIQGDYAKYSGGNSVMIPTQVLVNMLQNMAPQKNQAKDFAPGSPLKPYEGVVPLGGPRVMAYPVGINIQSNDRTLGLPDVPSFAQLRNLAQLSDSICLCERVILDMIPRLQPHVKIRDHLAKAGMDAKDYQAEIKEWMQFVEMPDPQQRMDIHSWLRMAWIETTQIDALSVFKQKNRGGKLIGANIVDGSTIKPIIDERGMVPQPPWPAYQQYPYGMPGDEYTLDQMVYYRESPRSFTPYGFSRVERIILRVNQALRKQNKDLMKWTEGNVPAGIMEVPDSAQWTPDMIDSYEQLWNSMLAGNPQQQVRIKFTQPGMKYTAFQDYTGSQQMTEFDEFLLNVAAACYGLSMGDLAFTGDIHKSSGDSQQNMMYRRTLYPLVSVYARLLTNLLVESTGYDMLEVDFVGFDEAEDISAQAVAYGEFVQNGILSRAAAARLMGFPEIPETGAFILPTNGEPLFLEDLADPHYRKVQQASRLANLQASEVSDQAEEQDVAQNASGNAQEAPGTAQQSTQNEEETPERAMVVSPLVQQQIAALMARVGEMEDALERFDPAHNVWSGKFDFWSGKKQHPGPKPAQGDQQQDKVEQQKDQQQDKQEEQAQDQQQQQTAPVTHTHSHSHGRHSHSHTHSHHGSHHHHSGHHHTSHGHHGTHGSHKGKHVDIHKAMTKLSTRASKASARFAKLAARPIGKHWTLAQQQAAQALSKLFTSLADNFEDIKPEHAEQLFKQIMTQGEALYGKGSTQYTHLQALLDHFDSRMDKIGVDRVGMPDFDEFEGELDDDEREDDWIDEDDESRVAEVLASIDEQLRLLRARNITEDVGDPPVMVSKPGLCDCEICRANAGQPIGERQPPYHDGCDCQSVPKGEEFERRGNADVDGALTMDRRAEVYHTHLSGGRNSSEAVSYRIPTQAAGGLNVEGTPTNPESVSPRMEARTRTVTGEVAGDERASATSASEVDHSRGASETERAGIDYRERYLEREVKDEYRRWQRRAIEDARAGKKQGKFSAKFIPAHVSAYLSSELVNRLTVDEVHTIFDHARSLERGTSPKEPAASMSTPSTGGNQDQSKSGWKLRW